MDRKKTIITAVLINAGVLAVLLIAALVGQEEVSIPEQQVVVAPEPLLPVETAAKEEQPAPPLVQLPPAASVPVPEEQVVHKLPPPAVAVAEPEVKPEPKAVESGYIEVVVKKGDTLEKIARAHQTTVEEILKVNQLPSSFLRIGQILKIPAAKTLSTAPKLKPLPPKEKTAGPEYYTVKVGDNPWTIAMRHHLKVDELLKLNGLNEEKARKLKPGDRLRIR